MDFIMKSYPKHKRWKSPKYLEYIRSCPCIICGYKEVDAHHVRHKGSGGTARKPDDYYALPICRLHHLENHQIGKDTFFERHGIDVFQELFRMVSGYLKKGEL